MKQNYLIRGVQTDLAVRVAWCEAPGLINAAVVTHDTDIAASAVFADALLAAAAVSVMLDDGERFTIRYDYPGTVKGLVTEVKADGAIRGLIQSPYLSTLGATDCDTVFGKCDGTLGVVRSKDAQILNSGTSRAPLADPAADLAFFFCTSDQLETELKTFVEWQPDPKAPAKRAGALLLQALPGCRLERFERIRQALHNREFMRVWKTLDPTLPAEIKLATLLATLSAISRIEALNSPRLQLEPGAVPRWHCGCSQASMKRAMGVLGKKELEKLFAENPEPAIECNFCRKQYHFRREDFFAPQQEEARYAKVGH